MRAVLKTAPTPVNTAQPNSAASAWSRPSASDPSFTHERRDTTTWSAKHDTPTWWFSVSPPACKRRSPDSSVPAVLLAAPGSHSAGRPSMHGMQPPQLGMNTSTTRSPARRSVTPAPHSTTSPAASCPSTIGTGRGRSPEITDRSEWHRPAARMRTSTSPAPGGSSSTSCTRRGKLLA